MNAVAQNKRMKRKWANRWTFSAAAILLIIGVWGGQKYADREQQKWEVKRYLQLSEIKMKAHASGWGMNDVDQEEMRQVIERLVKRKIDNRSDSPE